MVGKNPHQRFIGVTRRFVAAIVQKMLMPDFAVKHMQLFSLSCSEGVSDVCIITLNIK